MIPSIKGCLNQGITEMNFGVEGNDSSLEFEPHMAKAVAVRLFLTRHAMAMNAIALNAMAMPMDGKRGIFPEQIRAR